MDLSSILIGLAVFVISALLIYFISAISMKEKTFEEVIEEQKRRQEEENKKVKAEKKAEREQLKKRFKKGKQDKAKEPVVVQPVEPVPLEEPKMVNLEIEPEIIEPVESFGLSSAPRGKGKNKDKINKPILLNKDEVPLVAEKAVEVHHKPIVPKDDIELKKSHEVVVEKMQKGKASHVETQPKEKKSKNATESKENLPPAKIEKDELKSENKNISSKQKLEVVEKRPSKSKQAEETPMSGSRIISFMKTTKLADNEVQTLIDILLNKQGLSPTGPVISDDSWNKKSQKGDPVYILKKQLEEKEKALQDEQNIATSANARLKELRQDLMNEKAKHNVTGKQLKEKQAEVEALQARMQRSHEQHVAETKNLQVRLKQQEQGADKAAMQKLTVDNKVLQESLTIKSKEYAALEDKVKQTEKEVAACKSKIQSMEASKKSVESKLSSSDAKVKKLEVAQRDVDNLISKRTEEVGKELRKAEAANANISSDLKKSEAKNGALSSDLQKATEALTTAEGEVSTLKGKLQELEVHLKRAEANKEAEAKLQDSERKRSDLEGNVKNLEKQLFDISHRLTDTDALVERLKQENGSLLAENKTVNEKLQSASAPNGDIHETTEPSMTVSEHERLLSEKTKEFSDKITSLENQKKAASGLQVQLDTKQSEVNDLKQQLEKQKTKNNELREKNWKAMEALEKAEKTNAEKCRALKSARDTVNSGIADLEKHDKDVFQRLFPDVRITEKGNHMEWVSLFEKQALKKLESGASKDQVQHLEEENKKFQTKIADHEKQYKDMTAKLEKLQILEDENAQLKSSQTLSNAESASKNTKLEDDNARLKAEVEHYQNVVSETANKVQQLEKSVDAEQRKWQERLKQAQSAVNKASEDSEKVQNLDSVVAQQEEQLKEYRRILASTEDSLQTLEAKVSSEEKSWQGKLEASQSEFKKVQEELTNLRQELLASRGSQEMQTKLVETEARLKETEERIKVITKEKETLVEESKNQLEQERKKNKDLSLNVVKLNGIIKTGHDALTEEQNLVKQLQEQLDTKSLHSTTSDADEIDQAASTTENGTSV